MKQIATIAVALLFAVSVVAMPLAAADLGTAAQQDATDRGDESVAPGEQLAGVVGVQGAEIEGEVSQRAYGIRMANAQSEAAKAEVVERQMTDVEDRLDALEERREEVNAAYETGEISYGEYRAELAHIEAERRTAERLANDLAATATELDADLLDERGVDAEAIRALTAEANDLGGPEVADVAQSIVGDRVGQPIGPDFDPGASIDRPQSASDVTDVDADDAVADAENATDGMTDVGNATDEIPDPETATDETADVDGAVDDATDAVDGDDSIVDETVNESED